MVTERSSRLLALALLGGVLLVLLMAAGTLTPASELHHYPDADDLSQDYAAHQGERVEVSGTIVRTDPVVIEVDDADRRPTLTVTNVTEPVAVGQELRVFGTARPNETIAAHETVIVSPWETYYMWTVSFVAGVWVLVRFLRGWRFDRSTLSFASRGEQDA